MTSPFVPRLWAQLALVLTLLGCSSLDNCPDGQDPISIETGTTDTTALTYDSAAWDALDAFPAMTSVIFKHDLDITPSSIQTFLSFTATGTNGNGVGSVAESAGNQALIECVDSQVIVLKNDTCERDFFVRVFAVATPNGRRGDRSCSR